MRIKWLDGLKGLACFAVMWHHFMLAFAPSQYDGVPTGTFFDPVQNPLSFIVNGNFMVAIFMVVSGMAAALSIMDMSDKAKLAKIFEKRYFRLMLPVIPVALLTFIFSKCGLFSNIETSILTNSQYMASWYSQPLTLFAVIKSAVLTSWYTSDGTISGVFWVFPYFLWGFFLAAIISVMYWNKSNKTIYIYIIALVLFGFASSYYMAFVLGVMIVYLRKEYAFFNADTAINHVISIVLFVVGLILGGYPSKAVPTNFYRLLPDVSGLGLTTYIFWHVIGATLMIFALYNLKFIKKFFESRVLQIMGSISYEVFLVHMLIMCSFTCVIFRLLFVHAGLSYIFSVIITFIITNFLVGLVAYLYHLLVSRVKF